MRIVLTVLFSGLLQLCFGQALKKDKAINTVQTVSTTVHDTCLNKKFSVVFYAFQDTAGTLNLSAHTATLINPVLNKLNAAFARICVSFEKCSTVVIPNHEFNDWSLSSDAAVTSNWYTANTINIYLPYEVSGGPSFEMYGYAHGNQIPGTFASNKEVMIISGRYFNFPGTVKHMAEHFFELPDTFRETGTPLPTPPPIPIISNELVSRINCDTNGDGFCNTEADPYPISYYWPPSNPPNTYCRYQPVIKNLLNNYYTPPVDNFMSNYSCRCKFTQQQYNHLAKYILRNKMHLH